MVPELAEFLELHLNQVRTVPVQTRRIEVSLKVRPLQIKELTIVEVSLRLDAIASLCHPGNTGIEITSKSTKNEDLGEKKRLYEGLGVQEYWLFDPKGEWLAKQLQGYRLQEDTYHLITENISQSPKLRLQVQGTLVGFYRLDTGEKLLIPEELTDALTQEKQAKREERAAREKAEAEIARLKAQLRTLGVNPEG